MWTETGVWYDAEVLTINVNTRQAQLWYPSDEAEDEALGEKEDINIEEAILDDEVSWPLDESKMRVTSEGARENAKRLKRERDKQRNFRQPNPNGNRIHRLSDFVCSRWFRFAITVDIALSLIHI